MHLDRRRQWRLRYDRSPRERGSAATSVVNVKDDYTSAIQPWSRQDIPSVGRIRASVVSVSSTGTPSLDLCVLGSRDNHIPARLTRPNVPKDSCVRRVPARGSLGPTSIMHGDARGVAGAPGEGRGSRAEEPRQLLAISARNSLSPQADPPGLLLNLPVPEVCLEVGAVDALGGGGRVLHPFASLLDHDH
jgi:hypothetical protein